MSAVVARTRTIEIAGDDVDPNSLPQVSVLLVDDRPENLLALEASLEPLGQRLVKATSGEEALRALLDEDFAVILMDIKMPGLDGFETLALLRQRERSRHIPVIFLTAFDEEVTKVRSYKSGAVDYLRKPIDSDAVLAKVGVFVYLRQNEIALRAANDDMEERVADRTRELAAANDALRKEIDHRKHVERQLTEQASRDLLTGLPNRKLLLEHLDRAFARWRRNRSQGFAVMMLDLDRFKAINDSLGHLAGDELLVEVARRVQHCVRDSDTAARLGGDELAILLDGVTDISDATRTAERIQRALRDPIVLEARSVRIAASMGIAMVSDRYTRAEELLRDADTALYRAKDAGRSCFQFFDEQMRDEMAAQVRDEAELRVAVEINQLELYYQPIVSTTTGTIVSFEALLRWQHPRLGIVEPTHFIPLAEETGLIRPMGEFVVNRACAQLAAWTRSSAQPPQLAVNVSVQQLTAPGFATVVREALARYRIEPSALVLELTESTVMNAKAAEELAVLRHAGVTISLDDFGTGYSCLSQLQRLEVSSIKIDRSFIAPLGTTDQRIEIVHAIVTLAHNLGLSVVAEGVERDAQLESLRGLQCELAQGFLFAKPMPASAATALLAR